MFQIHLRSNTIRIYVGCLYKYKAYYYTMINIYTLYTVINHVNRFYSETKYK